MTAAITGQPQGFWSDVFTLLRAGWRISPRMFLGQCASLVGQGLIGGLGTALLIPIVNSIAGPQAGVVSVPSLGRLNVSAIPLWILLSGFMLIVIVQSLIVRSSTITNARYIPQMTDAIRQDAFASILATKWTFTLSRRSSDLLETVNGGASASGQAFLQILRGAAAVLLLAGTAVISALVSPAVTLVAMVGIALLALVDLRFVNPNRRIGARTLAASRDMQAVMQDSLDSLRLVRAHQSANVWTDRLRSAFAESREAQIDNARKAASAKAASSIGLAALATLFITAAIALKIPSASIVLLVILTIRMSRLSQQLGTNVNQLASLLPSVQALAQLSAEARAEVEVPVEAATLRLGGIEGERDLVELRDVTFSYPGTNNGVEGLSFSVPRGKMTVLTGHSGAGKSTTVDLVLGLLEAEDGQVLVNGEGLTPGDLPWWRSYIAYVPQETVLIPASLRENLAWSATRDVTDSDCWEALNRAAAGFAFDLPDGLDTRLGDRGLRLSGGERQRVAIARALLRQPLLLVLDEATSSLDDSKESEVLSALTTLTPEVTILAIAHRESTIRVADQVIQLSAGRVSTIRSSS